MEKKPKEVQRLLLADMRSLATWPQTGTCQSAPQRDNLRLAE